MQFGPELQFSHSYVRYQTEGCLTVESSNKCCQCFTSGRLEVNEATSEQD